MSFVDRDLSWIVKPSVEAYLPRDLAIICSESISPEAKSQKMQGDIALMVDVLWAWDFMQDDLRSLASLPKLEHLLNGELEELDELKKTESRLLVHENINLAKNKHISHFPSEWYRDENALDRWKIASEMSDVVVFAEAILRRDGFTKQEILRIFRGEIYHPVFTDMIGEMELRMWNIGMDMPETVILKTDINMQHRPPALLPAWKGNGFMKRMRKSIGDETSQMPHLASGPLGATVLTRLQAPIYAMEMDVIDVKEGELSIPLLYWYYENMNSRRLVY